MSEYVPIVFGVGAILLTGGLAGAFGYALTGLGTSLAFMGGSMLGSMLFPSGGNIALPKMSGSYPLQSAMVGVPVSVVFGTARVAGNIIYLGPLHPYKIKHKASGGKDIGGGGGEGVEETRYRRSFLIGICEGPASILRMWEGKKLMYVDSTFDFSQYGSEYEEGSAFSQIFTKVLGLLRQPPVTFFDGEDNTGIATLTGKEFASYRHLCCAFFDEYDCGNSESVPNFTFEVSSLHSPGHSPIYLGTDESPSGNDLFEVDYDWNKIHEDMKGSSTIGINAIVVQPSTGRVIVSGSQTYIYESDWTYVGVFPGGGPRSLLIDPDDDDYIYFAGSAGGVWKWRISTQVEQWHNPTFSAVDICISSDTGKLYICAGIGIGINEIDRSTGAHVRNLETAIGHGWIECYNEHIYAVGSRQFSKSVWRYSEASGSVINNYDTGEGTNRVAILNGKIYIQGKRSGNKTIWKFSDILTLEASYDDGNAVYWLNGIGLDDNKNQIVVGARGNSVDEDGNTANFRWFDSDLVLQDYALIYDNSSLCIGKAFCVSNPTAQQSETDMNPADIMKIITLDKRYAAGIAETFFDLSEYLNIWNYCDQNNIELSIVLDVQKPVTDWMDYIQSHYFGYTTMG